MIITLKLLKEKWKECEEKAPSKISYSCDESYCHIELFDEQVDEIDREMGDALAVFKKGLDNK